MRQAAVSPGLTLGASGTASAVGAPKRPRMAAAFPFKSAIAVGVVLILVGAGILWGKALVTTVTGLLGQHPRITDGTLVLARNFADDGQPQPGAVDIGSQRAVEGAENQLDFSRGDARSIVFHLQQQNLAIGIRQYPDGHHPRRLG